MKYTIIIATVLALVQAAPLFNDGGEPIADSYIVILKDGHSADTFQPKFENIARRRNARGGRIPSIHRKYATIPGFAATMDSASLKEIMASDEVAYVERDRVVSIQSIQTQNSPPSWGLTRISERDRDLNQPYCYNSKAGSGITAYVIDTGIYPEHTDFGGRASFGANFVPGTPNIDDHGHGTHVAGIIGGTNYGVAKKVKLVGVKVFGLNGTGSVSTIVAGMDWVIKKAASGKSVVNMSIGAGAKSKVIDDAAARLYAKNVPLFAAAGNSPTLDSCNNSPSGSPHAFTVAASDKMDKMAIYTSYGTCVKLFAPGDKIISTYIGSKTNVKALSGTSQAAPHVAGVAAVHMSTHSFPNPKAIYDKLIATSSPDKITVNNGSLGLRGTPSNLLYNAIA
ncbi:hypothetical protein BGZ79_005561 [Entomortierella chlamydospora]|nr:hypothetical protein BGZ79_005561 [Entomortierella chlamydospora]